MFILPSKLGLGGPRQYSSDFELSSSQYLSISNANWGVFDRAKFAISLWYKRESAATGMILHNKYDPGSSANTSFVLAFQASGRIEFTTFSAGPTQASIISTASFADTTSWHHIMVWYDSANATAGDRMRMWHDGTEITSFVTDINPVAAVQNVTTQVAVGAESVSPSQYYDGKLYQTAFFNGVLPAIGTVYDAGKPLNINGISGLFSVLNSNPSVVADDILAADWTNTNGVLLTRDSPR